MKWLVFVFGFVSAHRILKNYSDKNYLEEKMLTKIGTAYLIISFVMMKVSGDSFLLYVICILILVVIVASLPLFLALREEKHFEEQLPETLQLIAMRMSMGESFKKAFLVLTDMRKGQRFEKLTLKLYRAVTFPQQAGIDFHSSRLGRLLQDLQFISNTEYGAHSALKSLIHQQKMLSDFRRKSGKARAQILLQAWILTAIHIALTFFMISVFGAEPVLTYLGPSVLLMAIGHLLAMQIGKRVRWRI